MVTSLFFRAVYYRILAIANPIPYINKETLLVFFSMLKLNKNKWKSRVKILREMQDSRPWQPCLFSLKTRKYTEFEAATESAFTWLYNENTISFNMIFFSSHYKTRYFYTFFWNKKCNILNVFEQNTHIVFKQNNKTGKYWIWCFFSFQVFIV